MEEPDLVVGVAAVRTSEPSLESQIMYNTAIGNFQDALCCFERQGEVDSINIIKCYLSIDQPGIAARLAAGLSQRDKWLKKELAPLQAEAAWQLGEWQQLEEFTNCWQLPVENVDAGVADKDTSSSNMNAGAPVFSGESWEMGLSKAILYAYKADREKFFQVIFRYTYDTQENLSIKSYHYKKFFSFSLLS